MSFLFSVDKYTQLICYLCIRAPSVFGLRRALENISAILAEAGYALSDVVKTTVLLQDIGDFAAMNGVYATYFTGALPARVCYEVARLPMGARVEIDAVAVKA